MSMQSAINELRRLNRDAVSGFAVGDVDRVARSVVRAYLQDWYCRRHDLVSTSQVCCVPASPGQEPLCLHPEVCRIVNQEAPR